MKINQILIVFHLLKFYFAGIYLLNKNYIVQNKHQNFNIILHCSKQT